MIIDITNPKKPVEKFHIPGVAGAQTQSNRMCLGSQLGGGLPSDSVYLMRNVQSNNAADTGYQVWDVTDVTNPTLVYWLHGITRPISPGGSAIPASLTCRAAGLWTIGARPSRWSSSIGVTWGIRNTSALTGCRVDNRVEQGPNRLICMVRSPRTNIPMRGVC